MKLFMQSQIISHMQLATLTVTVTSGTLNTHINSDERERQRQKHNIIKRVTCDVGRTKRKGNREKNEANERFAVGRRGNCGELYVALVDIVL